MTLGKLQVFLVNATGLEDSDYLSKMDPYVILSCRSNDQRSSVAIGKGSNPQWNETFEYTIYEHVPELHLKIMDKDTFSADDLVGEVKIPLEDVYETRNVPAKSYEVVKDGESKGEIRVGLTFFPETHHARA